MPLEAILDGIAANGAQPACGDGESGGGTANAVAKLVRVSKVLRLVRVVRLTKLSLLVGRLEESGVLSRLISPPVLRLVKYFFFLLLMWHYMGCFWLYLSIEEDKDEAISLGVGENLWVPTPEFYVLSDGGKWLACMYWAMAATGSARHAASPLVAPYAWAPLHAS